MTDNQAVPVNALQAILPASAHSGGRNANVGSKTMALAGSGMVMLILGSRKFGPCQPGSA